MNAYNILPVMRNPEEVVQVNDIQLKVASSESWQVETSEMFMNVLKRRPGHIEHIKCKEAEGKGSTK